MPVPMTGPNTKPPVSVPVYRPRRWPARSGAARTSVARVAGRNEPAARPESRRASENCHSSAEKANITIVTTESTAPIMSSRRVWPRSA